MSRSASLFSVVVVLAISAMSCDAPVDVPRDASPEFETVNTCSSDVVITGKGEYSSSTGPEAGSQWVTGIENVGESRAEGVMVTLVLYPGPKDSGERVPCVLSNGDDLDAGEGGTVSCPVSIVAHFDPAPRYRVTCDRYEEELAGQTRYSPLQFEVKDCLYRTYYWHNWMPPVPEDHFVYHTAVGAQNVGEISFPLGFDEQRRLADGMLHFTYIDDIWDSTGSQQLSYATSTVHVIFTGEALDPIETDHESYWDYEGEATAEVEVDGWTQVSYIPDPANPSHVFYKAQTDRGQSFNVSFEVSLELLPSDEWEYDVILFGDSAPDDGYSSVHLDFQCSGRVPLSDPQP